MKVSVFFLYDILVYSHTFTNLYKHLRIVFEFLRKHQRVAKASKCNFCSEQMEYLSHIIYK